MNKTELITYLRDPNQLSSSQLAELEDIVNENPYFLSARLLLAKAGKEHKHPKTRRFVASAAIYSTDRRFLQKYLNDNLFFLGKPSKAEAIPTKESSVEDKIEISKTTVSKEPRKDKRPSAIKAKVTKPQPEIPEFPSGDLDSILEELQHDMENLKASREKFIKAQEKIEEDDAVSEALQKASSKSSNPISESPKAAEEAPIETNTPEEKKILPQDESDTDKVDDEIKRSSEEIKKQALEAANKAKEEVNKEDGGIKSTPDVKKDIDKTEEEKSEDKKKDDDSSDPKSQQEIISKFIKKSPSIKYQPKEEIAAKDLAEESAVWDSDLASEYLAEIYLKQGNKKRTIEIYEVLSLKYPEKKSYFADLISKIK